MIMWRNYYQEQPPHKPIRNMQIATSFAQPRWQLNQFFLKLGKFWIGVQVPRLFMLNNWELWDQSSIQTLLCK
jgi:hypothetical protein